MVFQFLRHFWNGNIGFFPDESDTKKEYTLFTLLREGILPAVTQQTMYAYKLLHFAKTSQHYSTKNEV